MASFLKRAVKAILPKSIQDPLRSWLDWQRYRRRRPRVLCLKVNGKRLHVSDTSDITHFDKVAFGDNVFIWHYTILDSYNGIRIGDGCQIGTRVGIFTHSTHISTRLYGDQYYEVPFTEHVGRVKGSVEIGPYCFIGPNSILMPNTRIGKGSLVAAYSLVHGEFPDYSVISGNPAKVAGDTRRLDRAYLVKHPELRENYLRWSGELPEERPRKAREAEPGKAA